MRPATQQRTVPAGHREAPAFCDDGCMQNQWEKPSFRPQALATQLPCLNSIGDQPSPPSDLLVSPHSHQVGSNAGTNKKASIDIHRVAAVLGDLGEATDASSNGEGEHKDGFQQLGGV